MRYGLGPSRTTTNLYIYVEGVKYEIEFLSTLIHSCWFIYQQPALVHF